MLYYFSEEFNILEGIFKFNIIMLQKVIKFFNVAVPNSVPVQTLYCKTAIRIRSLDERSLINAYCSCYVLLVIIDPFRTVS